MPEFRTLSVMADAAESSEREDSASSMAADWASAASWRLVLKYLSESSGIRI